MKTRAAVLWEQGRLEILEVELAPPRAGELLVRVAASGVCHSDLHVVDGDLPEPLPLVLGHEAAGVVVETGEGVDGFAPGDHVVLSIVPSCGACAACVRGRPNFCEVGASMAATGTLADGTSRLSLDGTTLHHFNSVSSFSEHAVVPASATVAIPHDVPLEQAALISCAVVTGYGAVVNTAGVGRGESVAVWGCGGVGLNVVQAARIAGADPIVAIDVSPEQLERARRLGATLVVDARAEDPVEAVRAATGGGVDFAFEALGREQTIQQAWAAARAGGSTVVIGMMPKGSRLDLDPWYLVSEKRLIGCYFGSASIHADIPRIVELHREGSLRLDELVARRIALDEVPDALDRMRAGDGARSVVLFDAPS